MKIRMCSKREDWVVDDHQIYNHDSGYRRVCSEICSAAQTKTQALPWRRYGMLTAKPEETVTSSHRDPLLEVREALCDLAGVGL